MTDFKHKYGPWALITGGAQGMGAAFARAIATEGVNLILLDREAELLATAVQQLRDEQLLKAELAIDVVSVCTDLAKPEFMDDIERVAADKDIGMVVACAAIGHVGPFAETPLEKMLDGIAVNVSAPLMLARHFCGPMIERGCGGIILFASSAAYQGTPYVANYAATKAYNLSLGEGLWYELREQGVDVLSISPGATNTSGYRSANPRLKEGQKVKGVMLPEDTASAALQALGKKPSTRPSFRDELETFFMSRVLNRRKAVSMIGDKINANLKRNI